MLFSSGSFSELAFSESPVLLSITASFGIPSEFTSVLSGSQLLTAEFTEKTESSYAFPVSVLLVAANNISLPNEFNFQIATPTSLANEWTTKAIVSASVPAEWKYSQIVSSRVPLELTAKQTVCPSVPSEWTTKQIVSPIVPSEWTAKIASSMLIPDEWKTAFSSLVSLPVEWKSAANLQGVLPVEFTSSFTALLSQPVAFNLTASQAFSATSEWTQQTNPTSDIPADWLSNSINSLATPGQWTQATTSTPVLPVSFDIAFSISSGLPVSGLYSLTGSYVVPVEFVSARTLQSALPADNLLSLTRRTLDNLTDDAAGVLLDDTGNAITSDLAGTQAFSGLLPVEWNVPVVVIFSSLNASVPVDWSLSISESRYEQLVDEVGGLILDGSGNPVTSSTLIVRGAQTNLPEAILLGLSSLPSIPSSWMTSTTAGVALPVEWGGSTAFTFATLLPADWSLSIAASRYEQILDGSGSLVLDDLGDPLLSDTLVNRGFDPGLPADWSNLVSTSLSSVLPVEWAGTSIVTLASEFPAAWALTASRFNALPMDWTGIVTQSTSAMMPHDSLLSLSKSQREALRDSSGGVILDEFGNPVFSDEFVLVGSETSLPVSILSGVSNSGLLPVEATTVTIQSANIPRDSLLSISYSLPEQILDGASGLLLDGLGQPLLTGVILSHGLESVIPSEMRVGVSYDTRIQNDWTTLTTLAENLPCEWTASSSSEINTGVPCDFSLSLSRSAFSQLLDDSGDAILDQNGNPTTTSEIVRIDPGLEIPIDYGQQANFSLNNPVEWSLGANFFYQMPSDWQENVVIASEIPSQSYLNAFLADKFPVELISPNISTTLICFEKAVSRVSKENLFSRGSGLTLKSKNSACSAVSKSLGVSIVSRQLKSTASIRQCSCNSFLRPC